MKMGKSIVCTYLLNSLSTYIFYYFEYTLFIFICDFGKAWYKHVALSDQSASEVDQQKKNKFKNKRCWSKLMMSENSDTSDDEGNKLTTYFFIIIAYLLILFLTK